MAWWWMSFADPDRPKGRRFLGALLIEADTDKQAISKSHVLGLNPGGEIVFFQVPAELEHRVESAITYRLLSREECDAFERKWLAQ